MIQHNGRSDAAESNAEWAAAIAAARNGSVAALGDLLEHERPELLELALGELGSTVCRKESASDIVQESLLDAVADFAQFQGVTLEELRSWLRQIVRHRAVDAGRRYRQAEMRDVSREQPLDARVCDLLLAPADSPSARVSLDEDTRRLQAAVNRLPEPHRTILRLRNRDGRSFTEIGAAQHCSEVRARRAWYEALLLLQQELKESP